MQFQIQNVFSIFDASELTLPAIKVLQEPEDMDNFYSKLVYVEGDELTIEYSVGDEMEGVVVVNDETIQKAYLFESTAYRGTGVYGGLVKVDGKWFDCDFVSEGMAGELDMTDEEIEAFLVEVMADQDEEDEE